MAHHGSDLRFPLPDRSGTSKYDYGSAFLIQASVFLYEGVVCLLATGVSLSDSLVSINFRKAESREFLNMSEESQISKKIQSPSSTERKTHSSFKENKGVWISLFLSLVFLVLFLAPWMDAVAVLPGKDEAGNDITVRIDHYFSMAQLLYNSKVFFFFEIIILLCLLSLLICSSVALFKKLDEKKHRRLTSITFIILCFTIVAFLAGLILSFASMPCY